MLYGLNGFNQRKRHLKIWNQLRGWFLWWMNMFRIFWIIRAIGFDCQSTVFCFDIFVPFVIYARAPIKEPQQYQLRTRFRWRWSRYKFWLEKRRSSCLTRWLRSLSITLILSNIVSRFIKILVLILFMGINLPLWSVVHVSWLWKEFVWVRTFNVRNHYIKMLNPCLWLWKS